MFAAVVVTGALGLHVWGNNRIATYDGLLAETTGDALPVRIVQPNISQKDKWDPEHAGQIIDTYLKLTGAAFDNPSGQPPLIVWPESALPRLIGEQAALRTTNNGQHAGRFSSSDRWSVPPRRQHRWNFDLQFIVGNPARQSGSWPP